MLMSLMSVSDHQLIYCTRKINKIKTEGVYKQIDFRSFKKYTVDAYKDALKKVSFPNYELFNDINEAYSNFFQEIRILRPKVLKQTLKNGFTRSFRKYTH